MRAIDPYAGLPVSVPRSMPGAQTGDAAARNSLGTTPQEIQQNFMRLLLAQIANQDPLNPSDPAEMTAQLSQLNTVSSLETLNSSVRSMLSQVSAQSFVGASGLVGREAMIPGDVLSLKGDAMSSFGLRLSGPQAQLALAVVDGAGAVVDELALGGLGAGNHRFVWDGQGSDGRRLPDGNYRLIVRASDPGAGGVQLSTSAVLAAVVRDGDKFNFISTDGRTVTESDIALLGAAKDKP